MVSIASPGQQGLPLDASHVVRDSVLDGRIEDEIVCQMSELLTLGDKVLSPFVVSDVLHFLVLVDGFELLKDGGKVGLFRIGIDGPCFSLQLQGYQGWEVSTDAVIAPRSAGSVGLETLVRLGTLQNAQQLSEKSHTKPRRTRDTDRAQCRSWRAGHRSTRSR